MSRLDDLLVGVLLVIFVSVLGWYGVNHYGAERYTAGYDAAVAAGKEAREAQATANLAVESGLRTQLAAKDVAAFTEEQNHAQALADAQRRVRAGVDGLRCPAAGPIQPATSADGRPIAAAPATDGAGPDIVPEVAADLLGYGAAVASLVRRYDDVVFRFEACRAVNSR